MSIQGTLDELKALLEPYVCDLVTSGMDPDGYAVEKPPVHVYLNDLRPPKVDEDDEAYMRAVYPFVLLCAPSGSVGESYPDTAENGINVVAVIGVFADGEDKQGKRDVCTVIDRILCALQENPYTEHCRIDSEASWQIDDGEEHPYYFGTVTFTAYDRLTTRAEYDI